MHISRTVEVIVGFFVAIGFIALFFLSMQVSNLSSLSSDAGYQITARFENIGSLKVRSPVTVAGVKVGRVSEIEFDSETFEAFVTMKINGRFDRFPVDSSASILTAGLLGEQYIGLDPGGDDEFLVNHSELEITQSALLLEKIIGQFLFSQKSAD